MRNTAPTDAAQLEALETREWLDSLDDVLKHGGPARVGTLLRELGIHAQKSGVRLPFTANTPYINTINGDEQVPYPGSAPTVVPPPPVPPRTTAHIRVVVADDHPLAGRVRAAGGDPDAPALRPPATRPGC